MLTYAQSILLGAIQGISELFPVSSLGHSVILPSLFGWNIRQGDNFFLVFLVATHLGTALVLLGFFFREWVRIIVGMMRRNANGRLGWLIIAATVPAGIFGLIFESRLKMLFASPRAAALFLIANGLMLLGAELLRRQKIAGGSASGGNLDLPGSQNSETSSNITFHQSLKIGLAQCLALIPGFSRTGATLSAGLLSGFSHENAARFSFLLSTPIILAAAVLKLPSLFSSENAPAAGPILAGTVAAAVFAYASVKFLLRYFETRKLWPFGIYCVVAGIIFFIFV